MWTYYPLRAVDCANATGGEFPLGYIGPTSQQQPPPCVGGMHVTEAFPSWSVDDNLPQGPTYEAICTYSLPNGNRYNIPTGAGAYQPIVTLNYPCPPPPPGYGAGVASEGAWTQSGGTHTALMQEVRVTEPGGYVCNTIVGPNETPQQVTGISNLTNPTVIQTWYEDPSH